jgi:hypothetical protein
MWGVGGEECDVIYVLSYCSSMSKMLLSFAVLLSFGFPSCLPVAVASQVCLGVGLWLDIGYAIGLVEDIMEILNINTFTFATTVLPPAV